MATSRFEDKKRVADFYRSSDVGIYEIARLAQSGRILDVLDESCVAEHNLIVRFLTHLGVLGDGTAEARDELYEEFARWLLDIHSKKETN